MDLLKALIHINWRGQTLLPPSQHQHPDGPVCAKCSDILHCPLSKVLRYSDILPCPLSKVLRYTDILPCHLSKVLRCNDILPCPPSKEWLQVSLTVYLGRWRGRCQCLSEAEGSLTVATGRTQCSLRSQASRGQSSLQGGQTVPALQ